VAKYAAKLKWLKMAGVKLAYRRRGGGCRLQRGRKRIAAASYLIWPCNGGCGVSASLGW